MHAALCSKLIQFDESSSNLSDPPAPGLFTGKHRTMANPNQQEDVASGIAKQFVHQYYEVFDADRSRLGCLYTPDSVLSFEGNVCRGQGPICEKLTSLPFKKVTHVITVVDSLFIDQTRLLITVIGQLKADDDPPHGFSQTFILGQVGESLMVFQDIFRLIVHNM